MTKFEKVAKGGMTVVTADTTLAMIFDLDK